MTFKADGDWIEQWTVFQVAVERLSSLSTMAIGFDLAVASDAGGRGDKGREKW